MSLELSLYHLAEGGDLLELFEMRAEAQRHLAELAPDSEEYQEPVNDLKVLDDQITAYMAALPAKVDSVRHVWKRIEVLIQEAADEVKFQQARGKHMKADLERLKDYCQRCMELIEWKSGKPREVGGAFRGISCSKGTVAAPVSRSTMKRWYRMNSAPSRLHFRRTSGCSARTGNTWSIHQISKLGLASRPSL